jgi:hypothetical protein
MSAEIMLRLCIQCAANSVPGVRESNKNPQRDAMIAAIILQLMDLCNSNPVEVQQRIGAVSRVATCGIRLATPVS